jgi:hypothetical protein
MPFTKWIPILAICISSTLIIGCSNTEQIDTKSIVQKKIQFIETPKKDEMAKIIALAKEKIKVYNPKRQNYVCIIDFSKPLNSKRLYVVDTKKDTIVLHEKVAHAYRSRLVFASKFSNQPESRLSCKGGFITDDLPYTGRFGYSLRIDGKDKNINDNAKRRAIILHSMKKIIGFWTWGCFGTEDAVNTTLINLLKGGHLIYVF